MSKPRRLTSEYVKSLPPAPLRNGKASTLLFKDTGHRAVSNLHLRVTSGGAKSWVLIARFPSAPRHPAPRRVGDALHMTLTEARDIAIEWNKLIAKKIDPQQQAKQEAREREAVAQAEARKNADTFGAIASAYTEKYASKKRRARDIAGVVRRDLVSRWGDLPIRAIAKRHVIGMLEDMEENNGTWAAGRAHAIGRALFEWALEREHVDANPFAAVRLNKIIGERRPRTRVLQPNDLKLFWAATEGQAYPSRPFHRLLLVLGVRRDELRHASWDEIDLDAALWRLPDYRVKNSEPRIIPLPRLACEILGELPRFAGGKFVFSLNGSKPWTAHSAAKARVERRMVELNGGKPIENWRHHDLRRSFRSNLSALPTVSFHLAELMLGHRQGGITATYDRHEYLPEQRAAYEAWCARLLGIVEPRAGNVVELRA
jgi:integrase